MNTFEKTVILSRTTQLPGEKEAAFPKQSWGLCTLCEWLLSHCIFLSPALGTPWVLHNVPSYVAVALRGWGQHGTQQPSELWSTLWGLGELLSDKNTIVITIVTIIPVIKWL